MSINRIEIVFVSSARICDRTSSGVLDSEKQPLKSFLSASMCLSVLLAKSFVNALLRLLSALDEHDRSCGVHGSVQSLALSALGH